MGNGLRPDVWEKFQKRFGVEQIIEFYASSEGNASLVNNTGKVGAIGFVPNILTKIYPVKIFRYDQDADELVRDAATGLCVEAKAGETGQVMGLIKDDDPSRRFDGYTDKKATAKKVARDVAAAGDAWFCSGDLLKKDDAGFFYWVDRIGDTFRWKGENISTAEVEGTLAGFPAVADANVYGIEIPGADGRAGCARLNFSAPIDEVDLAALYAHLIKNLQKAALPAFFRTPLAPVHSNGAAAKHLTATFKHKKTQLRKEGYDLQTAAAGGDAVYVRDDGRKTYRRCTPEDAAKVARGELKL